MYNFGILDPRPQGDATNKMLLGRETLGIEVTIPALAKRCGKGNIDPQHLGGDSSLTAIEVALTFKRHPRTRVWRLVTLRADADSIGAMAVIVLHTQDGREITGDALSRVLEIADFDKFANGAWPGERPLPTRDNPWGNEDPELAALNAMCMDFRAPIDERVALMKDWIMTGELPLKYIGQVERDRMDMISALEGGLIEISQKEGVAVVVSTHRAGLALGYALAPVVVALNPAFSFQGGQAHTKFTVSQYKPGHVDLKAATSELSQLEEGWGGSPTIAGSPQGVPSLLTIDQVVEVVQKHLL